MWTIGNVILKDFEVEEAARQELRDVGLDPVQKGDTPSLHDKGTKSIELTLRGTVLSRTKMETLKTYNLRANNPVDVQEGVLFDNCEDIKVLGWYNFVAYNDASVGVTTTKKIGTNAIYVKGSTTDYPYVQVNLQENARDWSDFDEFDVWLAPLDDDSTPATGLGAQVRFYDGDSDSISFNKTLSSTGDTYLLKRCELDGSGQGDSPDASSGTFDYDDVQYIRIIGNYADNNKDFAFDHMVLSREGEYNDGQYRISDFAAVPVAPVPNPGGWEYELRMVYQEALDE